MGDKVGSAFVVKRRCRLARPSAAVAARLRFRKGDRGEGKVVVDVGYGASSRGDCCGRYRRPLSGRSDRPLEKAILIQIRVLLLCW
jgi:hypothetical protein